MKFWIFIFLFIFAKATFANDVKISLLTCSPGSEIYSTYGHSAILVEYPALRKKVVYNYGTFDFNTPNFAVKFIKGDLLYKLSPEPYSGFINEYQHQGRGIIQEEFDLTDAQKKKVLDFLSENLKPENRTYLYDFFFDNCSTRIRDLAESELGITYKTNNEKPRSFRTLLKPYLSDTPWYHFGTNLILGKPTDDLADTRMEMFLPDYLSAHLAKATIGNKRLLKPAIELLPRTATMEPSNFNAPIYTMIGVLLLSLLVTFRSNGFWQITFDTLVFGTAILSGLLFTFMWTSTQHAVCHQNFNLLWGNPLFLILPIFALLKLTGAWKAAFYYLILSLLLWFLLPQKLPLAMLFFMMALLVRAAHRSGLLPSKNN